MAATMRAKLQVSSVFANQNRETGETISETLHFHGVSKSSGYPSDGTDEDNTFAKFSPSINLQMEIANPALFGKFEPGQKFYCDFTLAD
jgi:hypothetical protein